MPIFKAHKRYGCAYTGVIKHESCKTTTRSIKLKQDSDLTVTIQYKDMSQLVPGSQQKFAAYKVKGIAAYAEGKEAKPKVELVFELDKNGLVSLASAGPVVAAAHNWRRSCACR